MKTLPIRRRKRGFTLIELLVVIAIIAVLAAAGFGMVNVAINKAKKLKAVAMCSALETAVNAFYVEYGTLPDPTTSATTDTSLDTSSDQGITLLKILTGKEGGSEKLQNPKKMAFLTAGEAQGKKGGITYESDGTPSGLYDPWGNGYKVWLDYDYDELIKQPAETSGSGSTSDLRGRHSLVYSLGPEKKGAGDTAKNW